MQLLMHAVLLFALLAPCVARADVADAYALQVDGDHVRFTIAVNGLPVGAVHGRKLAGAAFFLDALLRPGDNEVTVATVLDQPYGTEQLTLTAPDAGGQEAGPPLWQMKCGFALANGTTPTCKPGAAYTMHFNVAHGPDFRLWHAQPATLSVTAIAASLAAEQMLLMQDAAKHDWTGMFLGQGVRKADLLQAGHGVAVAAAEMAKNMQTAAGKGGGSVVSATPPLASDLIVTALPFNLYAVSRKDGGPVLRVRVGADDGQDPEDFGDYSDRYLGGVYQEVVAIYGNYAGKLERVR